MNRPATAAASFLALFLLAALPSFPSRAGAWLQPEGEGQLIATALYYRTGHYYDNSRHRRPQADFSKRQINPYAEYGLTPDLTVGGSAFFDDVSGEDPAAPGGRRHNSGLSDPEVFARARLWEEGPAVISVQPLLKLPSLYASGGLPKSGSGEFDSELRLLAGYGFYTGGLDHFASAETAYRRRYGDPSDQFHAAFTLGLRPADKWLILPQVFAVWRVNAPGGSAFTQSGEDDYDLVKTQLSAVYEWTEDTGVQIGAFRNARARNTGGGGGALIAVWKRF